MGVGGGRLRISQVRIVPGEQEAREEGDSNLPSGGREGDSLGPTLENPGHENWKKSVVSVAPTP